MSHHQIKSNTALPTITPEFNIIGQPVQSEPLMYREAAVQDLRNRLQREKQRNTNLLATKKASDAMSVAFGLIALVAILALAWGGPV